MESARPNVEVTNLTKVYGRVTAIKDVSFSIARGEIVGFLGPNGAGKSTTLRILCGLIPATSGTAHICEIPVASQPGEIKRRIGYLAENTPLPEDMRVIEYLTFRGRLKEIPRRRLKARVEEVMNACDLNRKARRSVIGTLSKGYRQRVGVADAILAEPEVIIMDEPTIGLDPHQLLSMRSLIDSFRGKMTVIISSHILAEVELYCDRVIIINQGRIVAIGDSKRLRKEFVNKTTYTLGVKGDLSELSSAIRKIDSAMVVTATNHEEEEGFIKVVLETPRNEDLGEKLLANLHGHPDLRVRSLVRVEPSLEDIFLAATRKSWETIHSPGPGEDEGEPSANSSKSE